VARSPSDKSRIRSNISLLEISSSSSPRHRASAIGFGNRPTAWNGKSAMVVTSASISASTAGPWDMEAE
jgi:hypothetical protein